MQEGGCTVTQLLRQRGTIDAPQFSHRVHAHGGQLLVQLESHPCSDPGQRL